MKICNQEMALFSFTIPDYIFSDLPTYKLSLYVPSADTIHMDSHFSCLFTKTGGFSCSNFQRRSVFDNLVLCVINFTAYDPIRFRPICGCVRTNATKPSFLWATLLAMIAISTVQSSTRTLLHNVILPIDTYNNAWYNPSHLLIRTSYLAIISSNDDGFYSYPWVCLKHHNITNEWVQDPFLHPRLRQCKRCSTVWMVFHLKTGVKCPLAPPPLRALASLT